MEVKRRGHLMTALAALTTTVTGVVIVVPILAMGTGSLNPQASACAAVSSRPDDGSPTILGPSMLTLTELVAWWTSTGRGQPQGLGLPIDDVLAIYLSEAEAEGVRGDLAIVQAIYETGWFTNSDTARNNFAGIAHYDGTTSGDAFPDVATGIRAHVQLLKKYAGGNGIPLVQPDVAPEATARASTWDELSGTWATSPHYWAGLSRLYDSILRHSRHDEAPAPPAPECAPPRSADPAVYDGTAGTVPLTTVENITVHTDIADQVAALVQAARADGHTLTGGGYRSPERQIELRRAHCGTSHYAVYEMPSSQCTPPTARPGSSNHERGLAIDFECDGALIRSRSSACFAWMLGNAPIFGLHNLPSEPWHWSTNGT
jgi:hypothetical protein